MYPSIGHPPSTGLDQKISTKVDVTDSSVEAEKYLGQELGQVNDLINATPEAAPSPLKLRAAS